LGVVLNFNDPNDPYRLQDTNILNPVWVTGGVYRIINNNLLMQRQGVLDLDFLGQILDAATYPPDRRRVIVGMMERFELCFPFPEAQGQTWLVPELLPKNEPDLDWKEHDSLNFEYHYDVLPSGLICRFIVRMHRYLTAKRTYWRSGVVLEIEGNRVLVRGD